MRTVLIGIQARSGSTRLPRKAFEPIGGKWMLDHVIERCKKAAAGLNGSGHDAAVKIAVLTPKGDPIVAAFKASCSIFEGSEIDVLERYALAAEHFAADLIIRITGDCPLIPHFTINRIAALALQHRYDYISNVDERFRTARDGSDVEAISVELLKEAHEKAKTASDREHVTTWIRRNEPAWAKFAHAMTPYDDSAIKLSVDTPEDLERVRHEYLSSEDKLRLAVRTLGRSSVHLI